MTEVICYRNHPFRSLADPPQWGSDPSNMLPSRTRCRMSSYCICVSLSIMHAPTQDRRRNRLQLFHAPTSTDITRHARAVHYAAQLFHVPTARASSRFMTHCYPSVGAHLRVSSCMYSAQAVRRAEPDGDALGQRRVCAPGLVLASMRVQRLAECSTVR